MQLLISAILARLLQGSAAVVSGASLLPAPMGQLRPTLLLGVALGLLASTRNLECVDDCIHYTSSGSFDFSNGVAAALPCVCGMPLVTSLARAWRDMLPASYRATPIRDSNGIVCSTRHPTDGYCDDGGPGASYESCHLGRDCSDCGGQRTISTGCLCSADGVVDGVDTGRVGCPDESNNGFSYCYVTDGSACLGAAGVCRDRHIAPTSSRAPSSPPFLSPPSPPSSLLPVLAPLLAPPRAPPAPVPSPCGLLRTVRAPHPADCAVSGCGRVRAADTIPRVHGRRLTAVELRLLGRLPGHVHAMVPARSGNRVRLRRTGAAIATPSAPAASRA